MVVDYLDVFRAGVCPAKTQAELIVHANTILAGTVALQGFQAIARWRAQKLKGMRRIELHQLTNRHERNRREPPAFARLEQSLSIDAAEALDHGPAYNAER